MAIRSGAAAPKTAPEEGRHALLVLADGTTFEGEVIGAVPKGGVATGEAVFNTVLSGYQEVISDPSYAGQVVAFTASHIGNYGTTSKDDEAAFPACCGVIVRELARRRSNWRSHEDLSSYLARHGIPGLGGVDTRRLTRHLRDHGAMPCAFGIAAESDLLAAAAAAASTDGCDLAARVSTTEPYTFGEGQRRVVAYDFGIKRTILRQLASFATVEVVPAATTAAEVLARKPEGVFLSNGPGDPASLSYAISEIGELLEAEVPIFGICLGHQLMGAALGANTFKLSFGHHGGNHPVRNLATGKVEITSQNHNYCVSLEGLERADLSHLNLNDETVEGLQCTGRRAFSVQYHPEAGPGPHDSRYLFRRFADLMDGTDDASTLMARDGLGGNL